MFFSHPASEFFDVIAKLLECNTIESPTLVFFFLFIFTLFVVTALLCFEFFFSVERIIGICVNVPYASYHCNATSEYIS